MAKSPPSTPFYWNDYFRDTRVLQPSSRGIWMDLLIKMHECERRGEVTLPLSAWLQWCSCPQDVFLAALQDIALTKVGLVLVGDCDMSHDVTLSHMDILDCHRLVTVKNRRMMRERTIRQSDRLRQQKSRASRNSHSLSHADVTEPKHLPSSSFSSSLSHWEPPNPLVKGDVTASTSDRTELRSGGGLQRLSDGLKALFGQHVELPEVVKQGEG